MERKTARMQISLEKSVQERIDTFSKKVGISRSALIAQACNAYIDAQERLPDLMVELNEMKAAIVKMQNQVSE